VVKRGAARDQRWYAEQANRRTVQSELQMRLKFIEHPEAELKGALLMCQGANAPLHTPTGVSLNYNENIQQNSQSLIMIAVKLHTKARIN